MFNWLRGLLFKPKPEWVDRLDYAAARLGMRSSRYALCLDHWAYTVERAIQRDLAARRAFDKLHPWQRRDTLLLAGGPHRV